MPCCLPAKYLTGLRSDPVLLAEPDPVPVKKKSDFYHWVFLLPGFPVQCNHSQPSIHPGSQVGTVGICHGTYIRWWFRVSSERTKSNWLKNPFRLLLLIFQMPYTYQTTRFCPNVRNQSLSNISTTKVLTIYIRYFKRNNYLTLKTVWYSPSENLNSLVYIYIFFTYLSILIMD